MTAKWSTKKEDEKRAAKEAVKLAQRNHDLQVVAALRPVFEKAGWKLVDAPGTDGWNLLLPGCVPLYVATADSARRLARQFMQGA